MPVKKRGALPNARGKGNVAAKTNKKKGGSRMTPSMGDVIIKARSEMTRLTGLEAASTVKTVKDEKGWRLLVEMIEKRSIPDSMDILAAYEILMDDGGNLLEFNRKGMRKRVDTTVSDG
ncbi:MAG: gas vesicle protein GvpO [Deltaproteobacteria bacterium]